MSFSAWFKWWIGAFCKLFAFDRKKTRSASQREKERIKRIKAKFSSENYYRTKKKHKKRRSSMDVQNERLISGLFSFVGASLGILLLPFGLLDFGRKSYKARKALGSVAKKTVGKSKPRTTASSAGKASATSTCKKYVTGASTTVKSPATHTTPKPSGNATAAPARLFELPEAQSPTPLENVSTVCEPDENIPKSTPKNEKDQYIRKRMIIAGSYYFDKAVLDTLEVGSRIDLETEPDNPYDKDAVKLLLDGQKIGYIAKEDRMAFVTYLKLKRRIYGVITAIIEDEGQTKYEYETWFDSDR